MLSYEEIFFEGVSVELIHSLKKERLSITNDEIHCTFKYHPNENEIFNELVGKEIEVLLVGYGFDGKNSGFTLQLPNEIMNYYINYDGEELIMPHITASLSEDSKAFNTRNLHFETLKEPVAIKGRFGYWIKEEANEHISYEPYHNEKIR